MLGGRSTWAGFAAILNERRDEIGMHRRVLPLGAIFARWAKSLLCIAECAGVSGRGYYAARPVLDVPGRPAEAEPSLYVLGRG